MYFVTVILLLLVLPLASVAIDALRWGPDVPYVLLIGKWFVFWAVGVRLAIAGVRQVFGRRISPPSRFLRFTSPKRCVIVRELGFARTYRWGFLVCAACGISNGSRPPSWAASYGLAGLGHIAQKGEERQGIHGHDYRPARICRAADIRVALYMSGKVTH